jgi:hypothetical protein
MPGSGDEERWAIAARLAVAAGEHDAVSRRTRTFIWISCAALSVILFVAVFHILVFPFTAGSDSAAPDAPLIVSSVLAVTGTSLSLGGLTWAIGTGRIYSRWSTVRSALTAAERRTVKRQFAGREEVPRETLPVLLAIAYQERRTMWGLVPIFAGVILLTVGSLVHQNDALALVSSLCVLVSVPAMLVYVVIGYRAKGRFLAEYGTA